jgi:penicillin-binding protein 2
MVDALGWPRDEKISCKPVSGNTLELTIDFEMQMALERSLEGERGAAVLLDVLTGDVLAMASYPGFDPNLFTRFIPSGEWSRLNDKTTTPLVNRALEGEYQPGSTFKVVTGCSALQHKVVAEDTTIVCGGKFMLGQRAAYCWKVAGHGSVQFRRAISQSCNVFFYTIGAEIDITDLAFTANAFGLGHKTGICLKHERSGIIPDEKWRELRKKTTGNPWTKGDTVNSAIGQGDILVTPLQMARVVCAVSNGGKVFRPRLVKRILSADGRILREIEVEEESSLAFTPDILEPLRDGMKEAVQAGTCRRARMKGVTVLGKTGTAENPGRKTHAWFIGAMETHNPSVAIAVLLENAGAGSTMAVPVGRKIFDSVKEIIDRRILKAGAKGIVGTVMAVKPPIFSVEPSILSSSVSLTHNSTDTGTLISSEEDVEIRGGNSDEIGIDPDDVYEYEAGEDELYVGTL